MRRSFIALLLAAILLLAGAFRLTSLDTYGFSDDEAAKLAAIESYRGGILSGNAEHPMLMKLMMWGSLSAVDRWNRSADPSRQIARETALRLPNAVAGVATVGVVFAVTSILFGDAIALAAAALVAVDPNVTAINRIGKEDTLLMLFFLLAVLCYERAKQIIGHDQARAQRWYALSGANFGLMLASKYLPHLYGLYALYNVTTTDSRPRSGPNRLRMHLAMAAAFAAANVGILFPSTWVYIGHYLKGGTLMHHGQMYGKQLYVTDAPVSFAGVPFTYYVDLIGTKVPVAVLAFAAAGLVPLVIRRNERGFVWLRIFLIFLFLGYSVMAAKFQRYSLPILLFIDMLAAVGLVWGMSVVAQHTTSKMLRVGLPALICALTLGSVLVEARSIAPFYSVYQNTFGTLIEPPVTRFPEEAYDYGIREAVEEIARAAPAGSVIVSDVPAVVSYYLTRSGRRDLKTRSWSMQGFAPIGEQWVLVQNDHIYFENVSDVAQLRRAQMPWRQYRIRNTPVLEVFHLSR